MENNDIMWKNWQGLLGKYKISQAQVEEYLEKHWESESGELSELEEHAYEAHEMTQGRKVVVANVANQDTASFVEGEMLAKEMAQYFKQEGERKQYIATQQEKQFTENGDFSQEEVSMDKGQKRAAALEKLLENEDLLAEFLMTHGAESLQFLLKSEGIEGAQATEKVTAKDKLQP